MSVSELLTAFHKLSANDQQIFLKEASAPPSSTTTTTTTTAPPPTTEKKDNTSVTGSKPSSHVAQQPGGNSSLNLFGGGSTGTGSSDAKSAYYAAGNKQNASSIFDAPTSGDGKSSTRVAQQPGGSSSISLGSDNKVSSEPTVAPTDFHAKLKQAIAEKNPSFQAFFKTASQGGRVITVGQLTAGLVTLLGKDNKLPITEDNVKPLFAGKTEIGQSEFTKLFAQ